MSDRFEPREDPRPDDTAWPDMVWPVPDGTVLTGRTVTLTATDPHSDAGELFHALDDDAVWRHVRNRPRSVEECRDQLAARQSDAFSHVWTVRSGGRVVGMTSYHRAVPIDAWIEIGFTVYARHVWGSTVNPECKLLLMQLAFDTLRCGRVELKTDVRNHRSQQAIARLGATYEGTLRRYQRRADGTVRDTVLFSILAEEWPAVRAGLEHRLAEAQP